jgi:phosphocarrier protein
MTDDGIVSESVKIVNKKGLHARAAAAFVRETEKFDAEVEVERDGKKVSGGSIMGLMMLGAAMGEQITITCRGKDAENTLAALKRLIDEKFYED